MQMYDIPYQRAMALLGALALVPGRLRRISENAVRLCGLHRPYLVIGIATLPQHLLLRSRDYERYPGCRLGASWGLRRQFWGSWWRGGTGRRLTGTHSA